MRKQRNKSVLVLAGHLDDSIIAVGGILGNFIRNGWQAHVFCFGNNDEAFAKPSERDAAPAKGMSQAVAAHKIIGATSFECYNLPDFGVQRNRETYRACIGAIRKHKPDIILAHYWREYFQHHDMAKLACDSWWQAGWECSADLGKPWRARAMYHFEIIHDLPDPTHIVDVSDSFAGKIKAFRQFESETAHLSGMIKQLEARARYHGSKIGVKYAEVLKQSFFIPYKVVQIGAL